ncbi:MAG: efflux RND transporter periplasmic adaptor subunit [Caldilineaceae bacterium]|nr:efflux RND transporter periplasmic adaptor subunit [Caldilineaceae bacterium]
MNRRHLLLTTIVLIAAAAAVAAYLRLFQTSDAARAVNLSELEGSAVTTRIRPADASIGQLKAAGNINLIEEAQVVAHIDGFVKELLVEVGDTVNAGDPLLSLDQEDLKRAVEQARIDLASSQLRLRRLLTSADEIDLELGKLGVAQAELDLQKALQDLAAAQMAAPITGSVLTLNAAPGTKVSSGTVVATLADPGRLELTVQVAEVDIPRIESGRPVEVVIDAFPDETFAGEISRIDPFNKTQSGIINYPVTIRLLDNDLGPVLPGMTAVATLRNEPVADRWLVPTSALQEANGETVVTVLRGQERLPTAVTPEGLHGEWTIVHSVDLKNDDEVLGATATFVGE